MAARLSCALGAMHLAAPSCPILRNVHAASCHQPLRLESTTSAKLRTSTVAQPSQLPRRRIHVRAGPNSDEIEEDEEASDWEDEEDELEVEEFDDVRITTNEQENNTITWADYLATSIEGSTIAEIEAEERLAGVELKTSPLAAAIGAAAAAAAEDKSPIIRALESTESPPVIDPIVNAASASKFFDKDTLSLYPDQGPLTEWDLRASMEKRRRMEREKDAWMAEKTRSVGRYRPLAADWRTDLRIKDTGDPTQAVYREWTIKEIWDLITLDGASVDPRALPFKTESPTARTDFVAEGFYQHPEIPEFLAMQGRLIDEEDEADVVDADAEALLASEFSDFEDFGGDQLADTDMEF